MRGVKKAAGVNPQWRRRLAARNLGEEVFGGENMTGSKKRRSVSRSYLSGNAKSAAAAYPRLEIFAESEEIIVMLINMVKRRKQKKKKDAMAASQMTKPDQYSAKYQWPSGGSYRSRRRK